MNTLGELKIRSYLEFVQNLENELHVIRKFEEFRKCSYLEMFTN